MEIVGLYILKYSPYVNGAAHSSSSNDGSVGNIVFVFVDFSYLFATTLNI